MAANVILSNGDVEYDVASDMDPGKSDVAGHVSIHLSGFFPTLTFASTSPETSLCFQRRPKMTWRCHA